MWRGPAARRAAEAFTASVGHTPTGVWSAPGRVNLIGEHTDYNGGLALPLAIAQRTAVAAAARGDGRLSVSSVGSDGKLHPGGVYQVEELSPGSVAGWAAYPLGVAWALRTAGPDTVPIIAGGADLVVAGDVPAGAGLSSSHALGCATALALLGVAGFDPDQPGAGTPDRRGLVEISRRAENDFVGVPTGILDQSASLLCQPGHALLLSCADGMTEQVPFDPANAGFNLLVIDTRSRHTHRESGYAQRRRACARAAQLLAVATISEIPVEELTPAAARLPEDLRPLLRHVLTENERVRTAATLLRAGRVAQLGNVLTASHASLRDEYRVSCPELDLAVSTAGEAGALGARMTGGGFGGSAIALVPAAAVDAVGATVRSGFARAGLIPPRLFSTTPAAGAGRDR